MSINTKELRAQLGKQVDFTTGVTPTVNLRGLTECKIGSQNEVEVLEDINVGFAGGTDGVVKKIGGKGSFQGWACYEHINYFLEMMMGVATPSGAGPYVRTGSAPVNTAPTPRFGSFVHGPSTTGAYALIGAMMSSFKLTFEPGKEAMMNGDLIGNKVVADTVESLAVPTVLPIMGDHLDEIYIDAWGGTIGSTAMTNCDVRMAELTIEPKRDPRACFGTVFQDNYVNDAWDGTLKLSLEFNATSKAFVDAIIGGTLTQKQVRLVANGSATQILQLDFAGTVEDDLEIFDDDDGIVAVELSLKRTYHPTLATWFSYSNTCGTATLT